MVYNGDMDIVGLRIRLPQGRQTFCVVDASESFVQLEGETTHARVTTSRRALESMLETHPEREVKA